MKLDIQKSIILIELALFISQNSNTDVFVNYHPHVDGLDVRVYMNGWNLTHKEDVKKYNIRGDKSVDNLTKCDHLKNDFHYIDNCIRDLEEIADTIPGYLKLY